MDVSPVQEELGPIALLAESGLLGPGACRPGTSPYPKTLQAAGQWPGTPLEGFAE